mmetsp:Transcript_6555/g.12585  ORF Transcript_6555/g.12585 Transcript_6555/m.12585 type:complete len:117 (-) Transcript_6555:391-741(-)
MRSSSLFQVSDDPTPPKCTFSEVEWTTCWQASRRFESAKILRLSMYDKSLMSSCPPPMPNCGAYMQQRSCSCFWRAHRNSKHIKQQTESKSQNYLDFSLVSTEEGHFLPFQLEKES